MPRLAVLALLALAPTAVAADPDWAFRPPGNPTPPAVNDAAWVRDPIDRFILAKLEEKGLKPAPPADRRTLIRRATFDLTGLPPTPEEVEAFVADKSPDAYERLIDRLLASPAYGERWGRHWLDLVRYCDSFDARGSGGEGDCAAAWRYRDWVVDALNRDLPYDRFVRMQLAGDVLDLPPEERVNGIVATGMLAIGNWGGGDADKEKLLTDIADDQVDVVSRTILGLTLACARCHDHKFDPFTQKDYYALAGIFFSTHILPNVGPKTDGPPLLRVPLWTAAEREARDRLKGKWRDLARPKAFANGAQEGGVPGSPHAGVHDVKVHLRGRYDRLGELVPRGFPEVIRGANPPAITAGSGRKELADWITRPENPLTARVIVNRVWQFHFGEGIVRTPSNFGALGEPPTHPELLDYLARTFVEDGWSLKKLHRRILLSATYRQSAAADPKALATDPDNQLWARFSRRRLEAEAIRDSLLAVAGKLDLTRCGPSVKDFDSPRRTLYLTTVRSDRTGFGPLFDAADSTAPVEKRTVSTVAPQALFLMNHPFVRRQAEAFADRVLAQATTEADRLDYAHRLAFGRPPTAEERQLGHEVVSPGGRAAWAEWCHLLMQANEFVVIE